MHCVHTTKMLILVHAKPKVFKIAKIKYVELIVTVSSNY